MIGGVVTSSVIGRHCALCDGLIPWTKNDRKGAYAKRRFCSNNCRLIAMKTAAATADGQKQRFMLKVATGQDGTCWRWIGAFNQNGYGYFLLGGRLMHAHRASYALFRGDVPKDKNVCHACDNRWCVNPDHLWIGTQRQNVHDAMAKGRSVPPPRTDWRNRIKPHHWQRLSVDQAKEIIRRLARGEKHELIAQDFGINSRTVSKIKLGQRWPHLERP